MFCFFFQAEDGIRDWSVTGVQTCALPISPRRGSPKKDVKGSPVPIGTAVSRAAPRGKLGKKRELMGRRACLINETLISRSEERRVGKESRTRGERDGL